MVVLKVPPQVILMCNRLLGTIENQSDIQRREEPQKLESREGKYLENEGRGKLECLRL